MVDISFIHAASIYGMGMAIAIFKKMGWLTFAPVAFPGPADPSTAASYDSPGLCGTLPVSSA